MLKAELTDCFKRPDYANQISHAFEVWQTQRGLGFQNIEVAPIIVALRISPAFGAMLGCCLATSRDPHICREGIMILEQKLPELNSPAAIAELHDDLLRTLIIVLRKTEGLTAQNISGPLFQALIARQQMKNAAQGDATKDAAANEKRNYTAKLMLEYGPACSITVESFKVTLQTITANVKLDEEQLASVIILIMRPIASTAPPGDEKKSDTHWNLDVIGTFSFLHSFISSVPESMSQEV